MYITAKKHTPAWFDKSRPNWAAPAPKNNSPLNGGEISCTIRGFKEDAMKNENS